MPHKIDFKLQRDVPKLTGKVLLVTGGKAGSVSLDLLLEINFIEK
jgi:hypothetical protein